jgi:hypothetical protein
MLKINFRLLPGHTIIFLKRSINVKSSHITNVKSKDSVQKKVCKMNHLFEGEL